MRKSLAWLLFGGLFIVGCGGSVGPVSVGPASSSDVSLQSGDLPGGMSKCPESGDIESWLNKVKTSAPDSYQTSADQWNKAKQMGATEGHVDIYSEDSSLCGKGFAGVGAGANVSKKVAASEVIKFKDEGSATKFYKDQVASGSLQGATTGNATGLGQNSFSAFITGIGAAAWQKQVFQIGLFTDNLSQADFTKAAKNMDGRVH